MGDHYTMRRFSGTFLALTMCLTTPSTAAVAAAQVTRVNVSSAGAECDFGAVPAGLSADGRYAYFHSGCAALTPDGLPGTFRRDLLTNSTTRVGGFGQVSPDGRFLLTSNTAAVLTRRELSSGTEEVIPTPFGHYAPRMTPDGRYVSFLSDFVRNRVLLSARFLEVFDLQSGTTCAAHVAMDGATPNGAIGILTGASAIASPVQVVPATSADGRFVAFASDASNLVPGDTNAVQDVFVHDCVMHRTTRVSVGSDGSEANGSSFAPIISEDGRYVAFQSVAVTLTSDARSGVFIHDRQTGRTRRANLPDLTPGSYSWNPARGLLAVTLTHWPDGEAWPLWIYDLRTGTQLSIDVPRIRRESYFWAYVPADMAFSADGRFVTFSSNSADLVAGDTNDTSDVFVLDTRADADGDAIDDLYERLFGLDPANAADADADPDGDGLSSAAEIQAGSHPLGQATATRYFAEGASTALFDTRFELTNPSETATAHVVLRFERNDGTSWVTPLAIAPRRTRHFSADAVLLADDTEYATVIESDVLVGVERTMFFGGATPYGSHADAGVAALSTTWYAAEGATVGAFELFYLLHNPGSTAAMVTATFLLPSAPPVQRVYAVAPRQRLTDWIDQIPGLSSTEVSAEFVVTSGPPIAVERAMYLSRPGEPFAAGHAAAAVARPSTEWFFAEGSTGSYFDLFLLLANPGTEAATVEATYLLPDGSTQQKVYSIAPRTRFNIWVDEERFDSVRRLRDTAVSTVLRSLNGVPIVAERAMWWPGTASA